LQCISKSIYGAIVEHALPQRTSTSGKTSCSLIILGTLYFYNLSEWLLMLLLRGWQLCFCYRAFPFTAIVKQWLVLSKCLQLLSLSLLSVI